MTANKKLNEVIENQDIETLTSMINKGLNLIDIKLIDILRYFINNEKLVTSRFIRELIKNDINIASMTKSLQISNLMLLAYLGLDDIIEELISKGFDINDTNTNGMNTFHWAVAGGQYSTVKTLIEKDADIYSKAKFEITDENEEKRSEVIYFSSFAFAFNKYNPNIVKLLLNKGFNPNEKVLRKDILFYLFQETYELTYITNDPLDIVTKKNDIEILSLMIRKGNKSTHIRNLVNACENLNFDMIKILVENNTQINSKTSKALGLENIKGNPLTIVCEHSTIEPVNGNCATYLSKSSDEILEIIKYLVKNSADINNDSPLMAACSIDDYGMDLFADVNLEIIKYLIKEGADVNFTDSDGKSILMYATKAYNGLDLVKLLVENGAKVNYQDNKGNTVIMNIYHDPQYIHIWLKDEGIDEWDDTTPWYNPQKILSYLIENGANINKKNNLGMTALMYFSSKNNIIFVKNLLKHNADINAKSEMTALDLAQNDDIKTLIQNSKNNNPQKLVKFLSNFTIDKPIKYTTHDWDFGSLQSSEYKSFDGYMEAVKKQFNPIKNELKELSPILYKKIYSFLIDNNPEKEYSWCHKTKINFGWSSLKGLKEHCDKGKKPSSFILPEPIFYNGKDITTFNDVINLFKQEIEIRENFKNLKTILDTQKNKLGKGRHSKFKVDLSAAKLNRQFYSDVESLTSVFGKIFSEIKTRENYPNIEIITSELEDRSIELKITQLDSYSSRNAKELLERANEKGDLSDIKEGLKNICDWSIESSFEGNNFRINFLHSNNVKEIVQLVAKPKGFSQIFRFYK